MALPQWNTVAFGCLIREEASVVSLMRTQLSSSLPAPFVSRRADMSAPVELSFGIHVDDAGFRAWEQWTTYDLIDSSLPFTMVLPWGTEQPQVRCRLVEPWHARRLDSLNWNVTGRMQIERESLPRFSGGAL